MAKLCTLGMGGRIVIVCRKCGKDDMSQLSTYRVKCNTCEAEQEESATVAPLTENVRRQPL